MTPQTGATPPLDRVANGSGLGPRGLLVASAAPAAPRADRDAARGTVPQITVDSDHYTITASAFGHVLARAVRTAYGWHLPYVRAGRHEWVAYDSTRGAATAVYEWAVGRLYGAGAR